MYPRPHHSRTLHRLYSQVHTPRQSSARRTYWLLAAVASGGLVFHKCSPIRADVETEGHVQSGRAPTPWSALIRSYTVYSMCCVPWLIDWSPSILSTLSAVPGLRQLAEAFVRRTFFRQFVGGESAQETVGVLAELRDEHKGAMLTYNVEVDLAAAAQGALAPHSLNVEEIMRSIETAANFEDGILLKDKRTRRRTSVAIKLSALVPSIESLERFSAHLILHRPPDSVPLPGISSTSELSLLSANGIPATGLRPSDVHDLLELKANLERVCARAKERGVKIMIDAEHSFFQPAIDAYAMHLMHLFNRIPEKSFIGYLKRCVGVASFTKGGLDDEMQPIVYTTFQAYLRRTPIFLRAALQQADREGFALGVKLVRGAYHPFELERHRKQSTEENDLAPVWTQKSETDECYDHCVTVITSAVRRGIEGTGPNVGVLFGTHNWKSAKGILQQLHQQGLVEIASSASKDEVLIKASEQLAQRVVIAQLFGMCEGLTNYLVDHIQCHTPMVIKCVPYGALAEVIPYLGRRAIENKSILGGPGGASSERKRVGKEIRDRIGLF